jgi:hypothetical protein
MKDLILKTGSYLESVSTKATNSGKVPGASLEKFVINLLKNATCCIKVLDGATIQDSTIVLKTYTTTEINALTGMVAGTLVYDSTATALKFYNGSAWETVTSS